MASLISSAVNRIVQKTSDLTQRLKENPQHILTALEVLAVIGTGAYLISTNPSCSSLEDRFDIDHLARNGQKSPVFNVFLKLVSNDCYAQLDPLFGSNNLDRMDSSTLDAMSKYLMANGNANTTEKLFLSRPNLPLKELDSILLVANKETYQTYINSESYDKLVTELLKGGIQNSFNSRFTSRPFFENTLELAKSGKPELLSALLNFAAENEERSNDCHRILLGARSMLTGTWGESTPRQTEILDVLLQLDTSDSTKTMIENLFKFANFPIQEIAEYTMQVPQDSIIFELLSKPYQSYLANPDLSREDLVKLLNTLGSKHPLYEATNKKLTKLKETS